MAQEKRRSMPHEDGMRNNELAEKLASPPKKFPESGRRLTDGSDRPRSRLWTSSAVCVSQSKKIARPSRLRGVGIGYCVGRPQQRRDGKSGVTYKEKYPVGTKVRICNLDKLRSFKRDWKYHHPISDEQMQAAGIHDKVKSVGFYHGGDVLYQL